MKYPFTTTWIAAAACLLVVACENSTGPETTLPPLQKWSFSGYESTFKSGIAVRRRDVEGKLTTGLTVWLTDQAIDCSTPFEGAMDNQWGLLNSVSIVSGGWIGISYPEVSLGKGQVRLMVGAWPKGGGLNGNIDVIASAQLTKADTSNEKMVSGSVEHREAALDTDSPFGAANIKGSFTVPYCPGI